MIGSAGEGTNRNDGHSDAFAGTVGPTSEDRQHGRPEVGTAVPDGGTVMLHDPPPGVPTSFHPSTSSSGPSARHLFPILDTAGGKEDNASNQARFKENVLKIAKRNKSEPAVTGVVEEQRRALPSSSSPRAHSDSLDPIKRKRIGSPVTAFYPMKTGTGAIVPTRPMSPGARINFGHQSSTESIPVADVRNFLNQLRTHCESRWRQNVTELEQRLRNFSDEDRRTATAHFEGRERELEAYAGSLVQEIQLENAQNMAQMEHEIVEMHTGMFSAHAV